MNVSIELKKRAEKIKADRKLLADQQARVKAETIAISAEYCSAFSDEDKVKHILLAEKIIADAKVERTNSILRADIVFKDKTADADFQLEMFGIKNTALKTTKQKFILDGTGSITIERKDLKTAIVVDCKDGWRARLKSDLQSQGSTDSIVKNVLDDCRLFAIKNGIAIPKH